jgi:acyl carrier protein
MADTFDLDVDDIPVDASQQNFSPWTSLAQLTLLVALEEKFSLNFSLTEMNNMTSLSSIVQVLANRGLAAKL